jgi:hypothetical protein
MHRPLPAPLALVLLVGFTANSSAQDDAYVIIDRAIAALGGEARLAQYQARQNKTRGTLVAFGGIPFTQEVFYQSPGQIKEVLRAEANGKSSTVVSALDGDRGWVQIDGQLRPLDERMLAELKETAHLRLICRCTVLKDKAYQLTPLGEFPIDSRPALGIKVAARGYRDVNLYFDKEYGLLVKTERRALHVPTGRFVREEAYYKDWKAIDGIVTPTRVAVYHDGRKFMQAEAYDIQYREKIAAAVFAKP